MNRLQVAGVWLVLAVAAAAFAAVWTGVIMLFMHWPLHSIAVFLLMCVAGILFGTYEDQLQQLRRPAAPPVGLVIAVSDRPIELMHLRIALGEETYRELSQLTGDRVNE